ncbi:MAG: hypothetical protein GIW99_07615 [Candidatus Eremiobacteraeota bacterium]|nr:hypothetical protein [Candidatus Eremiobacteraeota bacterium]MBC5827529.1 hypothetical protein [Candidatus Eremiobacteraeota bacterium]
MFLRLLAATTVALLTASPVLAATTTIAELGSAPLLGSSASTTDLKVNIARNEPRLAAAAGALGMTAAEYRNFRTQIQVSKPAWVVVPRHLDGMTWYGVGGVHAIHDVMIPAGTRGWEVDIQEPGDTLAVFMPAACGNLSILRRATPHVAVVKKPAAVIASRPPWGVLPSHEAAAPVPVAAAAVSPSPAPIAYGAAPIPFAAPAHGITRFLPLLGLLLLPHGGGSGGSTGPGHHGGGGGGNCGCPPPPPPPPCGCHS